MGQTALAEVAPQKVQRYVREISVRYRGARFRAPMGILPRWILVQLEPRTLTIKDESEKLKIAAGDVWIPNRDLERSTKGATQYQRCDDLFTALRLCLHASDGYGHGSDRPDTESVKLEGTITVLGDIATSMSHRRKRDDPSMHAANDEQLMLFAADLLDKRDANKVRAGELLLDSLKIATGDRLGRPNGPGGALTVGWAIDMVMRRQLAMARIDEHVVSRATVIADYIADHLRVYEALWRDLYGDPGPSVLGEIWQMFHWITEGLRPFSTPYARKRAAEYRAQVQMHLESYVIQLRRMQAAPFRRNAWHLVQDLREAIKIASAPEFTAKHLADLRERLETIERGVLWMYELYRLHVELITPISLLLANGQTDSERLAFVPAKLEEFAKRVRHKCSDKNLREPVKERVLALIASASGSAFDGNWKLVKKDLVALSAIL